MVKRCIAAFLVLLLTLCAFPLPAAAEEVTYYKAVANDSPFGKKYVICDCDTKNGWIASSFAKVAFDEEESTEGVGSVLVTADIDAYANANLDIHGSFDPIDLSRMDMLSFDIYVSDLSLISSSYQIVAAVASGGIGGGKLLTWSAAMMTGEYVEGWNHMELPVSYATADGADMSAIDSIRVLFRRVNPTEKIDDVEIRIDNIRGEAYPTKAVMLTGCDNPEQWAGGVAAFDQTDHIQGTGCVSFRATTVDCEEGDHNMVKSILLPTPVDARNADYLEMDIYVSDADAIKESSSHYGLHIEITSAGTCDYEEYQFESKDFGGNLKDGWNHLRLPISSAGITRGAPDMRRLNFFRIHLLNLHTADNKELILKLDNIYLSVVQDGIEDYPEDVPPTEEQPPVGEDDSQTPPADNDPSKDPADAPDDGQGEGTTPGTETPWVDPMQPTEGDGSDEDAVALRRALTVKRARIVVVLFAFFILGADIVFVMLRRRREAEAVALAVDLPGGQESTDGECADESARNE